MSSEVFHSLKTHNKKGYNTAVGDEGGFAPDLKMKKRHVSLYMTPLNKADIKPEKDFLY